MSNWTTEKFKATDLTNKIKKGIIKVPQYQRGQIWKESQKEKLVDSIKNGFPFGTILLYKKEDNTFQLIDGLQRSSTIYEYLHTPTRFFRETDISKKSIEKIYDLLLIKGGNKEEIKSKIIQYIKEWVVTYNRTMEDVKNISAINCARYLQSQFPTCDAESTLEIVSILTEEFKTFRNECEDLSDAEIPAIVYSGNPDNLPEVFNRINSKGTVLSKYQILSATWATHEYTLCSAELENIIDYVDKFYISIIDENFTVDGYDSSNIRKTRRLNLYQILFGFSKVLSNKFPYLFNKSKNGKDIESCGFNLVNCCLGNKNTKIANLPSVLYDVFENDDDKINTFLVNVIHTIENVYKLFRPYLEFKLNKRDSSIEIYHSEFQICSIIANYFNARYSTYTYDELNHSIIGKNIKTEGSNQNFDGYKKDFKTNVFKKYLIDILNDNWRGSGDKKMDDISQNKKYYTEEITEEMMINELDHWINQINLNRHEVTNIAKPKSSEKLMLSVIYSHSFSAFEQNDDINYDIEHLATKGIMKILLKNIASREEGVGLPISSFANVCLLREEINRKKKDKTLYQDYQYLENLKEKNISLAEIETKFSFTNEEDLEWVNNVYDDLSSLKSEYFHFLDVRFKRQKEKIISNLFYKEAHIDHGFIMLHDNSAYTMPMIIEQNTDSASAIIPLNFENIVDSDETYSDIIENLTGWKKDIFSIIHLLQNEIFCLEDIYKHISYLKRLHPYNKNIEAVIRRTLQELRDIEIIEFIDNNGKYRKLWK